jgi:hypothetical protein
MAPVAKFPGSPFPTWAIAEIAKNGFAGRKNDPSTTNFSRFWPFFPQNGKPTMGVSLPCPQPQHGAEISLQKQSVG